MASALTVLLLGCWLAGRSGVSGERSLPKPSISVSPGAVIPVGGNVTIQCWLQNLGMRMLLYKAGDGNQLTYKDPAAYIAEFPIASARREQSGNYTCRYSHRTGSAAYSEPSDPVQIIVAELSFPKPSISFTPSGGVTLGGALTVQCRGQHRNVRFVLNKERHHFPPVDSDGSEAEFSISNVRRQHGGSYSCSYHSRLEPFAGSYPSDPMELVVRDPGLPRPSISLSPTGVITPGADVTIRCQGQRWDVRFFLHKAGDLNPQRHTDPAGAVAEFRIPSVGRQHGGSYSCSYRPRSEPFVSSQPSDPVQLVVADAGSFPTGGTDPTQPGLSLPPTHPGSAGPEPSYPKPNISLSPSGGVSLGGPVSIWCQGQHQGVRFVLNKEGRHFRHVDSDGFVAEFSSSNVHRDLGGSYSCSYHSKLEPFTVSYPSDPMELVVRDPGLPRPSISLSPTGVITPGADVTIQCQGQHQDVRFFLHKAGDLNPQRHTDPAGAGAKFHIPSVGRQHGGSYSCSYRPWSEPFVSSQPSDTVQLVVAEPSYPKPSISLSPSWGVSLGGAVTVQCQGQRQGVRFVLNKEGRHFRHVDSDGFGAEFPISNVRREHGGSYSCSYHSRSEPFAVSYPSDPVELVVRDPGLPRPSISLSPTVVTAPGADVTIWCQGQRRDVRFFLHKAGDLNPQRHMDPAGAEAEFRIPSVGRQHGGSYSCSYRPWSEPFVSSQPSDPVQLVVADAGSVPAEGTDSAQPGATPAPTRPGSAGPGGLESWALLGLTSPIIAGASAAAAGLLLLLLLVAFVCFRKTRAAGIQAQHQQQRGPPQTPNPCSPVGVSGWALGPGDPDRLMGDSGLCPSAGRGAAPRPSSTFPLGVLKAPAQEDPIYASVDEWKQPLALEPSPGTDRLTYAELDR
ncbi:alpha-1B-glycoprotein-like isoform 2-T2 [Pangshura tecta]